MLDPSPASASSTEAPRPRIAACLHGFLRTGGSMALFAVRLRRAGYREVALPTFGYHLSHMEAHAARAARVLAALAARHPEAELDVVTHSMGGLLARLALSHPEAPPARRVVMLSPPNQGAKAAELVRGMVPLHQLGWDPLHPLLPGVPSAHPVPPAEVGVLTGGRGDERGYNGWLGADNDALVRVDEAALPGATDFHVVEVPHALMPFHPLAAAQTLHFLEYGRFRRAS